MDPEFLEKEVSSAPEMQSSLGRLYIQNARTFQVATREERNRLLPQTVDSSRLEKYRQFVPRNKPLQMREPGGHPILIDVSFPVRNSVHLKPEGQSCIRGLPVCPRVLCDAFIHRHAEEGAGDKEGTVGLYFRLRSSEIDGHVPGAIVTSFKFLFYDSERKRHVYTMGVLGTLESSHVFKPPYLSTMFMGFDNNGLSWKEFMFCDGPLLKDKILHVRIWLTKLIVH
jgi:hypothetical protein